MHCALWRGCGGSTYGLLIVLRLCRMSTPPSNPPVGGCMPVNYCTLGAEKKGEEEREGMRSTGKQRRRGGGARDTEREKPPWL